MPNRKTNTNQTTTTQQ